jgi:molybdenum cofactor synthesis domain-containing protein
MSDSPSTGLESPVVIEILAVGNEVLLGDVQDTNTYWLCRQITGRGGRVQRVTVIGDEPDTIAAEVRVARERRPDAVITSGGLGPTDDDLTIAAVAAGLGVPYVENHDALALIEQRYAWLTQQGYIISGGLTPERRKMAWMPEGALPLANGAGTAPGVLLRLPETTFICLPGVPAELKDIFTGSLEPFLLELFGQRDYVFVTVVTDSGDESSLAPVLRAVVAAHPDVYIKSRATHFGSNVRLRITLSASGAPGRVRPAIDAVLTDLQRALGEIRVGVTSVEQ